MKSRMFIRKPIVLALGLVCINAPAWAQESTEPVNVDVTATRLDADAVLQGRALDLRRAENPDTTSLLTDMAGYAVRGAGAISNLPVIRGLADDRLTIKVDGVNAVASCPNHMNSPLSYVAPTAIEEIKVYKSITPVSVGGNSIGGAIVVDTPRPTFSEDGNLQTSGEIGAAYYSNGDGTSGNLSATAATNRVSVNYTGSTSSANNYSAARSFNNSVYGGPIATGSHGPQALSPSSPANNSTVGSTAFMTTNQAASLALKLMDNHTLQFQYSAQSTPFEGYPNQYMDMTGNQQQRLNLRYWGQYDWGKLEAQVYNETVNHQMNFGANRSYWYQSGASPYPYNIAGMPMNTNAVTTGVKVKGSIELGEMSLMRTGVEYQHYYLNDRWSPVANSGMMGPNTFYNINGGVQQTVAAYAEWEKRFDSQFKTILGARYEWVNSSTGQVQGYGCFGSMMCAGDVTAANALNSSSRNNTNNNVNLTAIGQYMVDQHQDTEIGLARQVRNPNLYELYSWSHSTMNSAMNNFVGDGNGYYGNSNLKAETAYTLSGNYDLHSADRSYQASLSPYYSYINNYIGAVQQYRGSTPVNSLSQSYYNVMQYTNQNAQLAGADLD